MIESLLKYPALFITGTDTDVGKSIVTAAMARALRLSGHDVCAIKPIATGCRVTRKGWDCEDARILAAASSPAGNDLLSCIDLAPGQPLVAWKNPLAPTSAARLEGRPLRPASLTAAIGRLRKACSKSGTHLLVEGVGGPLVPLTNRLTVADWMVRLGLPAVLVTRTELGTINHTLLAAECLTARGIRLVAIIASRRRKGRYAVVERESLLEIARLLPRVRLLVLDRIESPTAAPGWKPLPLL